MKTYSGYITELKSNQVFCFGSNLQGFHGAGAAGFASFGVNGNKWRDFDYSNKPNGWKGHWNIKGIGVGFQEGNEGKSYAIPTVKRAGSPMSLDKSEICKNIQDLYSFAKDHPDLEFLIAYCNDGKTLLNGYTIEEMATMFNVATIPENIVFEERFAEIIKK